MHLVALYAPCGSNISQLRSKLLMIVAMCLRIIYLQLLKSTHVNLLLGLMDLG
jgi:hypothetical protein